MDQAAGSGVSLDAQMSSIVIPAGVNKKQFKAMYNQYRLQMQQLSIRPDQTLVNYLTGISAIQDSIDYIMEVCQEIATAVDNIEASGTGQTEEEQKIQQDFMDKINETATKEAANALGAAAAGGVTGSTLSAAGSGALSSLISAPAAIAGGIGGVLGLIGSILGIAALIGSESNEGGGGVGSTNSDKYTTVNQMAQVLYSAEQALASLITQGDTNDGKFRVIDLSLGSILTTLTSRGDQIDIVESDVLNILLPGRLLTDTRVTNLEDLQVNDIALINANALNITTNIT